MVAVALVLLLCVLVKRERANEKEKKEFGEIFDEEYKKGRNKKWLNFPKNKKNHLLGIYCANGLLKKVVGELFTISVEYLL